MRALLVILALVFSSTAAARPTFDNPDCGQCHTGGSGGNSVTDISPDPINITIADSGLISFTLSTTNDWSLALFGLDALGLDATIINSAEWEESTGGYWYSDPAQANTTTSWSLDLGVGASASIDSYLIGVKLGVSGGFLDETSFNVNVVPIPAAVWLFGSGLVWLLGVARYRRNA